MYINEVLYHIDEDYKQYCDTIDSICEELLVEEDKKKDAWFFDMSPEKQQDYLKSHPDSDKAKELKRKLQSMPKKGDQGDTRPAPDKKSPKGNVAKTNPDKDATPSEKPKNDVGGSLPTQVADLKQHIGELKDAIGLDIATIGKAFKEPSVYNTVKAIGGSITATSKTIMGSLRTIGKSLTVGGAAIHDTKAFQQLEKGLIKTDEFMQKNKVLATMSAVGVSSLAIGQWLRMSFSGDIESDFDLTIIPQAFAGNAGFADLIATPDGIKGIGLLSAGMATGGLPIWMGGPVGLAMALTYSGLVSAGDTKKGAEIKKKMVDWADKMSSSTGDVLKKVDKKLGLTTESLMNPSNIDKLQFNVFEKLKKPKYHKVEIFEDGWSEIEMIPPPTNSSKTTKSELETVIKESNNATDEIKKKYINCADDPCYYIKEYMEDSDLEFDEEYMDYIVDQCTPVIRHFKNSFNRPRPYQVAEVLNMKLKKWKTGTANSPSYPSGHSMQPYLVANFYAEKYPEHEGNLRDAADICAYGRVQAGLHYPTDYNAGIQLADEMAKYLKDDLKEDAPVNATGSAVSTDTPLVRSRNKYLKKNKEDSKKIFGLLKRYSK